MSLSAETEIRNLPFEVSKRICRLLDIDDDWRKVAEKITVSNEDLRSLYNVNHLRLMASNPEGPAMALLSDWGTHGRKRPTVGDLIDLMSQRELYRAADYLSVEVLKGEPVSRPYLQTADAMKIWGLPTSHSAANGVSSPPPLPPRSYSSKSPPVIVDGTAGMSAAALKAFELAHPASNLESSSDRPVSDNNLNMQYNSFAYDASQQNPFSSVAPLHYDTGTPQPQDWSFTPSDDNSILHLHEPDSTTNPLTDLTTLPHWPYNRIVDITSNFSETKVNDGGRKLGAGAFSTVFLGILKDNSKVAVKKMDRKFDKEFCNELQTMTSLLDDHLLKLVAYSWNGPTGNCLIFDYMQNGSLQDRIALVDGTPPLPWKTRLTIAYDTASGLSYLHHRQLVHRDVKSANILLDADFRAKVGDFGIVHIGPNPLLETSIETTTAKGTGPYMPREAHNGLISDKIDCYSYGVVLLELLTGLEPLNAKRDDLVSVIEQNVREPADIINLLDNKGGQWDAGIVEKLYSLSRNCLQLYPYRPTITEVLPQVLGLVRESNQL